MANATNNVVLSLNEWTKITDANADFQNKSNSSVQYTTATETPADDTEQYFWILPYENKTYVASNDALYCRRVYTDASIAYKNT